MIGIAVAVTHHSPAAVAARPPASPLAAARLFNPAQPIPSHPIARIASQRPATHINAPAPASSQTQQHPPNPSAS